MDSSPHKPSGKDYINALEALARIHESDTINNCPETNRLQRLGGTIMRMGRQTLTSTGQLLTDMTGWQFRDKPDQHKLSVCEEINNFSERRPGK